MLPALNPDSVHHAGTETQILQHARQNGVVLM